MFLCLYQCSNILVIICRKGAFFALRNNATASLNNLASTTDIMSCNSYIGQFLHFSITCHVLNSWRWVLSQSLVINQMTSTCFVIVTLKQARTCIYMLAKTEAKTMYCFPLCFPQQSFIEFKNVSRLPTCCSKCTIKTINHITLFRLQKQQHIQFNDIHMHQS